PPPGTVARSGRTDGEDAASPRNRLPVTAAAARGPLGFLTPTAESEDMVGPRTIAAQAVKAADTPGTDRLAPLMICISARSPAAGAGEGGAAPFAFAAQDRAN